MTVTKMTIKRLTTAISASDAALHQLPVGDSRRKDERCRLDRLSRRLETAQDTARREFADARGWTYLKRSRTPCINRHFPELDHIDVFRRPGEAHARILVTHTYATEQEIAVFADKWKYRMEKLPWSWWAPDVALAALLVPRHPEGVQELI